MEKISENTINEINDVLMRGDIMLQFKLKLKVDEWGAYKKGEIGTFNIRLLDELNGLARFSIENRWEIVSCKVINC